MNSKRKKPAALTRAQMAAELGLSPGAVSSVINGRAKQAGIPESTVQRVLEHVSKRGYVPSRYACHLRSSPKRVIGIIYLGELFSHLIEGFHKLVAGLGAGDQALEISMTSSERVEPAVRDLLARRVTDLVWVNNNSLGGEEYRWGGGIVKYLQNTRLIIYNYRFNSPYSEKELLDRGVALVGIDRIAQARQLALYMKHLGHRVIALPDVPRKYEPCYFEVFESVGLTVANCLYPFTVDGMLKVMKEQGVTAACFHGDSPACLALNELRAAGVRVPEDLTVTGFDGMSKAFNPDLTTQAFPLEKMVAKVCELIAGTEKEPRHCFDLELIKGRTHGAPRKEHLVNMDLQDKQDGETVILTLNRNLNHNPLLTGS